MLLSNECRSEILGPDHLPMTHISRQRTPLSLGSKLQWAARLVKINSLNKEDECEYYHSIRLLLFLVTRIICMHWVWCFAKADVGSCKHLRRSVYLEPGFHAHTHDWLEKISSALIQAPFTADSSHWLHPIHSGMSGTKCCLTCVPVDMCACWIHY